MGHSRSVNIGKNLKVIMTVDKESTDSGSGKGTVSDKTKNCYVSGIVRVAYFPSVNSMYILARRRKVLCKDAVDIRNKAHSQMAIYSDRSGVPDDGSELYIEMGYYLSHSIRRRDLDNMFKFIIDTLSEFYSFNDNRIYDLYAYKRPLLDSDGTELLYYKIGKCDVEPDKWGLSMNELN